VPSAGQQGQLPGAGSINLSYGEVIAIQGFLKYLHGHYSKQVNYRDIFLIAAVGAWFRQESGGIKNVIGNNPFNIRPGMVSFMSNGYRVSKNGNGRFLTFATLTKGFEAAAYLLMHANKAYGYQLAIAALKHEGNTAAVDFLAALAMSSWDAAHYGANNWTQAYSGSRNHLLRVYASIAGVQLTDPHPKKVKPKKPAKPRPKLPRDFNYQVVVRNYLDPWLAQLMYDNRHRATNVDASRRRR